MFVATRNKLSSISLGRLRLEDVDEEVNKMLSGFCRIITGFGEDGVTEVAA